LFRILVQKICRAQPNQRSSGEPAFSGSEDEPKRLCLFSVVFWVRFDHFSAGSGSFGEF